MLPELKFVITKSSIESANASSAAARTPGAISGSVTLVKVVHAFAPRSCAASSMWRSKPINLDLTTTTTKLMQNITWAIRIVVKPVAKPIVRNSESSDAPSTISGEAIGRKMKKFANCRPRNWYRTRPIAISVPRMVAITVASAPISRLVFIASVSPVTAKGCSQCRSVNPCHVKLKRLRVSLNEKRMITAIGASR